VIDILHLLIKTAERYGLRILYIDSTDVTLMARMEILPAVYLQIYRNIEKDKLNMALVIGNERAYGVDGEGGVYHEHPAEDPLRHVPIIEKLAGGKEEADFKCLGICCFHYQGGL
jgi:hypothetical protein